MNKVLQFKSETMFKKKVRKSTTDIELAERFINMRHSHVDNALITNIEEINTYKCYDFHTDTFKVIAERDNNTREIKLYLRPKNTPLMNKRIKAILTVLRNII